MNGGLQVVNPSMAVYNLILSRLQQPSTVDYAFADQSLLSDIFRGRWVALPYVYNALKTLRWKDVHAPIWRDDRIKNIHYILTPKPWISREILREEDDETHRWFFDANDARLARDRDNGVDDGF